MIKLYEKDLETFEEIDEEQLEQGLENQSITTHIIKESVSAETIYKQLKKQGVDVAIHNGIYCKVVYETYEAINPIPAEIKYVKA